MDAIHAGCRPLPVMRKVALIGFLMAGVCMTQTASATYAVITVDVCWTCGTDFWGTWKGKDYGVPLIAEMLEQRGFKGSFFVSPYCPDSMTDAMISNLKFIVSRGHDIQLHTHPDVFDPSRPLLNMYSIEERREIFAVGIRNILEAGAPPPLAHRAGAWSIDETTLHLLPEFGIQMDSSIRPRSSNSKVPLDEKMANRFVKIGGVYQLPVFYIRILPYAGWTGTTSLQLDSTIWWQQRIALEKAAEGKAPLVIIVLHFSSLYRFISPAKSFDPLVATGPDEEKIDEFDNMLRMLQTDGRFKVVTASQLWEIHQKDPTALQGPSFIPYVGVVPTYVKCWKYFFREGINNKIVVLASLTMIGLIVLIGIVWIRARRMKPEAARGRDATLL
jgi:peptidoglycan/xylan/chitin deacetylase (PgdA/CDA1 family)